MNDTLLMILTWFSPLLAWFPLSGKDRSGEPSVSGRAEVYLLLGAVAALPAGFFHLLHFSSSTEFTYTAAYTFFSSFALEGIAGTVLPLAALFLSVLISGRPHNEQTGSGGASLVILAYCLVDGVFAYHAGPGLFALPEAIVKSAPKLALAPVWGFLMVEYKDSGTRKMLLTAAIIVGSFFSGLVGFFLEINLIAAAVVPSLFVFSVALGLRYRVIEKTQDPDKTPAMQVSYYSVITQGERKHPGYQVYSLMRDGRYSEARKEAGRYLEFHTDLVLYSWHALLRWMSGERAYRLIFLRRYKALGDIQRRKVKCHLESYLGEYSKIVSGWIHTLEETEREDTAAS